jgi:type I restriction enzyme M protein
VDQRPRWRGEKLFYFTQIPAYLRFVPRNRANHRFCDRRRQVLLIDARKRAAWCYCTHRDVTQQEIQKAARTYHA